MDYIDKKIINILKKGEENISNLTTKAFARESQKVFKRRLAVLEKKGILTVDTTCLYGKSYLIKLVDRKV